MCGYYIHTPITPTCETLPLPLLSRSCDLEHGAPAFLRQPHQLPPLLLLLLLPEHQG